MRQQFDLHTHSTASDGTLTPTALVQRAAAQGVEVLALTDHDVTCGLAEAAKAALDSGIALVSGIEVSVTWSHQTVHIVSLNIDAGNEALQAGLEKLLAFRHWRAEEIARRLEKKGIPGAYEGAQKFAKGSIIGRTHFARFLVEQGYAKDLRQVFKRYLVRNKPGFVPGDWASLEQTLQWIQGAGGQAVIAHPARYNFSATRMRQLVGEFQELGGAALEVVSGSHSRDEMLHYAQVARNAGLSASRGSDYHGPENPYFELGRLPAIPDICQPIWESAGWGKAQGAVAP